MNLSRRLSFRLLGAALCLGTLFAFGSQSRFIQSIEANAFVTLTRRWLDLRPTTNQITVVMIDEASLRHFGEQRGWRWPWPRSAHADLILLLKAAGAKEIRFDVAFSEPSSDAMEDDLLISMAKAAGNVWFASKKSQPALPGLDQTFDMRLKAEANGTVCRDPQTGMLLSWHRKPADEILSAHQLIQEGEQIRKTIGNKVDWLNPDSIQKAVPSITPSSRMTDVKDKIVFIGASAAATHDLQRLPLPGDHHAGVMVHVMARSNQITHSYFKELPSFLIPLGCLISSLLMASAFLLSQRFAVRIIWGLFIPTFWALLSLGLFHHLIWLPPVALISSTLAALGGLLAWSYWIEGAQKRRIVRMFGDFVSPEVVQQLVQQPGEVSLGGVEKELTVFFSDLEGFTTISEKLPPTKLIEILNFYLTEMSDQLIQSNGYLADYVGDGILGVFGAPLETQTHAQNACKAALASMEKMRSLSPEILQRWGLTLRTRIGIHTGNMVVGQLGSLRKMKYGVVGDAVNFGSRLEGLNKFYGTSCLVSASTRKAAGDSFCFRRIDMIRAKGKTEPIEIFELMSLSSKEAKPIIELSNEAWSLYRKSDIPKARQLYNELAALAPTDPIPQVFLQRLKWMESNPMPTSWDGVWTFTEK